MKENSSHYCISPKLRKSWKVALFLFSNLCCSNGDIAKIDLLAKHTAFIRSYHFTCSSLTLGETSLRFRFTCIVSVVRAPSDLNLHNINYFGSNAKVSTVRSPHKVIFSQAPDRLSSGQSWSTPQRPGGSLAHLPANPLSLFGSSTLLFSLWWVWVWCGFRFCCNQNVLPLLLHGLWTFNFTRGQTDPLKLSGGNAIHTLQAIWAMRRNAFVKTVLTGVHGCDGIGLTFDDILLD